jgi:hypothetical protein
MRRATALPAAALCTALLAPCGSVAASAHRTVAGCVGSSADRLEEGATLTVKVGALVRVVLYEPHGYESGRRAPRAFLWAAPSASDPRVLGSAALCPGRFTIGLRYEAYRFRALRPGKVTLTAPIAPAWRRYAPTLERVKPPYPRSLPHPYRATVIVTG